MALAEAAPQNTSLEQSRWLPGEKRGRRELPEQGFAQAQEIGNNHNLAAGVILARRWLPSTLGSGARLSPAGGCGGWSGD